MAEYDRGEDPVLEEIRRDSAAAQRGKLKIYLGMAAGVGKTYAMLTDAIELASRGVDVVVGYLEHHGRKDTEQLAERLERLPRQHIRHGEFVLEEFDLDAALARDPEIVLVDELAHTNAPGARHPKRSQDVEELLDAGIDVYTTVNVQHLESLRDVVAQVTGIIVQETVADELLHKADEVELVDIPPNDLIQRLHDGKVYPLERVSTALENFFKEGNLIALRELALRQTAERVSAQMHRYRLRHAVRDIWPTAQKILVCVGPSPMAVRLVRAAKRLASPLHGELIAVNLENPQYLSLSDESRAYATKALELASSIGAQTVVRPSQDLVADLLAIARENNVTAIVIGKPLRPRWHEWFKRSLVNELIRHSGTISIHVISGRKEQIPPSSAAILQDRLTPSGLTSTVGMVALATVICMVMRSFFAPPNLIMVYLLGVLWISSRHSFRDAAVASVLAVAAFDFFFVPPYYTFAVSDVQYLVTFGVMLVSALVISTLTNRLKFQARLVSKREQRTASLYDLSRSLLSANSFEEIANTLSTRARMLLGCDAALIVTDKSGTQLVLPTNAPRQFLEANERSVSMWCLQHNAPAGKGTTTLPGAKGFYLPLAASDVAFGVLALAPPEPLSPEMRTIAEAVSNQLSLSVQRVRLERVFLDAQVTAQREKIRSALLSSISHDLRTPLAVISGSASAMLEQPELPEANRRELASTIWEESERLSRVIRNVLDLTKMETEVTLQTEWHSLEEIIGSAVARASALLGSRHTKVKIAVDTPLVKVDGLLLEQLFVNLLENVARHTPSDSTVEIEVVSDPNSIGVFIRDNGPGIPPGDEERIFEKLYRAPTQSPGVGLGLTICRAVASAHGASLVARNRVGGGAEFELRLERSPQPAMI